MPSKTLFKASVIVVVVIPFLATVLAICLLWTRAVHWSDLALLATLYSLIAFGVTIGFHRMLTHRSFHPHPVVKLILLVLGSMSWEGPALQWAATHIKHHAHADREGDPHSPLEGFFHAHIGWMLGDDTADPQVYCRNLVQDPLAGFVRRALPLWVLRARAIPFALRARAGLLWGGRVRIV